MKKPQEIEGCSACGSKEKLKLGKNPIYRQAPGGRLYDGFFWVYKCSKCKNSFTTTESDNISLKYHIKLKSYG